jgi:hypothetical protein
VRHVTAPTHRDREFARKVSFDAGERSFVTQLRGRPKMSWQFTVGLRVKGKADRIVVDAEDALIAALKAKADQPGATIMYVRRSNRRGDTRHPPRPHTEGIDR